jgi:hypothetical protein
VVVTAILLEEEQVSAAELAMVGATVAIITVQRNTLVVFQK